jgi:hypothetical protein
LQSANKPQNKPQETPGEPVARSCPRGERATVKERTLDATPPAPEPGLTVSTARIVTALDVALKGLALGLVANHAPVWLILTVSTISLFVGGLVSIAPAVHR